MQDPTWNLPVSGNVVDLIAGRDVLSRRLLLLILVRRFTLLVVLDLDGIEFD